ncbi:hypothetical protein MKW98_020178 [Papaver atlanticum]|uniref:MCM C-terminal AAA(+) ATPase domain-containing protein n=1 Tax=Papaver atlanticum TaxID=357466 RepID=A0AAD4S9S5_9MAGN|nr:hypothetical protein MKW98_020178 [Papaver atlanticum]
MKGSTSGVTLMFVQLAIPAVQSLSSLSMPIFPSGYTTNLVPRSVYTFGKSSSAAALTAAVAKEPGTGEFCIEMVPSKKVCIVFLGEVYAIGVATLIPENNYLIHNVHEESSSISNRYKEMTELTKKDGGDSIKGGEYNK